MTKRKRPEIPGEAPQPYGISWTKLCMIWGIIVLAGLAGLLALIEREKAREIRHWQVRLELVADAQARDISRWLSQHVSVLKDLTDNPSLQLYMTELSLHQQKQKDEGDSTAFMIDAPAQTTYMRHLLANTAMRHGFMPSGNAAARIKANVAPLEPTGLALLDNANRLVVSSGQLPPLEGKVKQFVESTGSSEPQVFGPYEVAVGRYALAFMVPLYPVQTDPEPGQEIGKVLGVKMLDPGFFTQLKVATETAKTAESVLVMPNSNQVLYLSPLMDGYEPFTLSLAQETPDLAATYALDQAGGFNKKRDYRGQLVLVTGRALDHVPWRLMRKIDSTEAMQESLERARWMIITYVLVAGLLTLSFYAVWRQATVRKARQAAARYKAQAQKIEKQEKLLELITESTPNSLFMVDTEHRYRYINRAAAEHAGMQPWEMMGKSMVSVLGAAAADRYVQANRSSLSSKRIETRLYREESLDTGPSIVLQSTHIPMPSIPLMDSNESVPGVLVVERDLTGVVQERERRERTLKHLMEVLVTIVDQRDPFAAHHSSRVAIIARAVAEEMHLSDTSIETAEIAGQLMNVGKVLVPENLLTAEKALGDKEKDQIRASLMATADLMEGIVFDGPVVETLRQAQEQYDGTGPMKLKAADILPTAQIVAVANSFVALVSKRSYRPESTIDEALQILLGQIDAQYDRAPVVALVNYMDNRDGRAEWDRMVRLQREAADMLPTAPPVPKGKPAAKKTDKPDDTDAS